MDLSELPLEVQKQICDSYTVPARHLRCFAIGQVYASMMRVHTYTAVSRMMEASRSVPEAARRMVEALSVQ